MIGSFDRDKEDTAATARARRKNNNKTTGRECDREAWDAGC